MFTKEGIEEQGEENITLTKQFVVRSKKGLPRFACCLQVNDKNRMNQHNFQDSGF